MTIPKISQQDNLVSQETQTTKSFLDIAISEMTTDFATRFNTDPSNLEEDLFGTQVVLNWASGHMGQQALLEYFKESPYTNNEIMEIYGQCKTVEQKNDWKNTYSVWLQKTPSIKERFNQLTTLIQSQINLQKVYPEVNLIMVPITYSEIQQNYMPAFGANDTVPSRINQPKNLLAQKYGGEVLIDNDLLSIIRGKFTANPAGIDYYKTPYGELATKANNIGNYGLMLVDEQLYTRAQLQQMKDFTKVNTMSAGLVEGIALAKTGSLRIGDCLGFPKYIPNSQGDFYCGVNVERIFVENAHTNAPNIFFSLWRNEGSQNCVLAVTA